MAGVQGLAGGMEGGVSKLLQEKQLDWTKTLELLVCRSSCLASSNGVD